MITFHVSTQVPDDRRIVLSLPDDVPLGRAELTVTVAPAATTQKLPRTSLADWAEENAEHWAGRIQAEDVEGFTGRRY